MDAYYVGHLFQVAYRHFTVYLIHVMKYHVYVKVNNQQIQILWELNNTSQFEVVLEGLICLR